MSRELIDSTGIERTQNEKGAYTERFLDSSRDFFSFFKKNVTEVSNESQPLPVPAETPAPLSRHDVTDLLKAAYAMLDKAQSQLEEKDVRIRMLEKLATVDELTGLTNRRGFYEAFKGELDRTSRGDNRGGLLIMIDLDKFKAINDTYGHLAGDQALRVVAEFLNYSIRTMDLAARLGGDEFVLLLPNTCIAKAMRRADKLEKDLNALSFTWDGVRIPIRGSVGLQDYTGGDTIEGIISRADEGLYDQKSSRSDH